MRKSKQFRRPPKAKRAVPAEKVGSDGLIRNTITKIPEDVKRGFHAERGHLRKGWRIDEATRSEDGNRFDVVIEPEKFRELQAKAQARTDALAGRPGTVKSRIEGVEGETSVQEQEVARTQISAGKMQRLLGSQGGSDAAEE